MNNSSLYPALFSYRRKTARDDRRERNAHKGTKGGRTVVKNHTFSPDTRNESLVITNRPVEASLCANPSLCKRWFVHACARYTRDRCTEACMIGEGKCCIERISLSLSFPFSLSLDVQYESGCMRLVFGRVSTVCTKLYALYAIYARRGERTREKERLMHLRPVLAHARALFSTGRYVGKSARALLSVRGMRNERIASSWKLGIAATACA